MFDLVPFRNCKRRSVAEHDDDPFNMVSGLFNEVMDFADRSFRADIKETDDKYIIEAEMPGINKEDIQLELDDDYLTISVDHTEEEKEENENYIRRERRHGRYARSFYLENVKQDEITAEYNDGILTIDLPKVEKKVVKKRTIDIN